MGLHFFHLFISHTGSDKSQCLCLPNEAPALRMAKLWETEIDSDALLEGFYRTECKEAITDALPLTFLPVTAFPFSPNAIRVSATVYNCVCYCCVVLFSLGCICVGRGKMQDNEMEREIQGV